MAFRANESAAANFDRAVRVLTPRDASGDDKRRIKRRISELVDAHGPVVDAYPSWHPLVSEQRDRRAPTRRPGTRCGYKGLDHTVLFAHAFVSCPYQGAKDIEQSVRALERNQRLVGDAHIEAEVLDEWLYNQQTTAVLVTCHWTKPLNLDHTIPKACAVPMVLEQELPTRHGAEVAETWEAMRPYFLGSPHGARSSLFIDQEAGTAIRTIWKRLIESGAFGPIMV